MTPDVDRISRFLLDLYRDAGTQRPAAFQQSVMARLRAFIPFDFAAWGGALRNPVQISEVTLLGQPASRFRQWPRMVATDAFCNLAVGRIDETLVFDDIERYRESVEYRKNWCCFGIHQVLTTIITEPIADYCSFIGLCRTNGHHRYSERERRLKQLLVPHIASAFRLCREHQVLGPGAVGEGIGLVNETGLVLASRPPFPHLVREEWPQTAPWIPPATFSVIRGTGVWRGEYVDMRSERLAPYFLVRARACTPFAVLTRREQQVAERFACGHSHKEVARELGVAPATVRNQVAAIYEKLGVNDKVHLARLVHGFGSGTPG